MQFHVFSQPVDDLVLGGTTNTVVNLQGVAWDREVALVADMGEQRTGGYGVRITGISADSDGVLVTVDATRPGPGMMVVQVITRPYAVKTVSRSLLPSGRVTFHFRDPSGKELGLVQALL